MLSRALMMMSLETLKISFALDIKLFEESVSRDIGTEGSPSFRGSSHRELVRRSASSPTPRQSKPATQLPRWVLDDFDEKDIGQFFKPALIPRPPLEERPTGSGAELSPALAGGLAPAAIPIATVCKLSDSAPIEACDTNDHSLLPTYHRLIHSCLGRDRTTE